MTHRPGTAVPDLLTTISTESAHPPAPHALALLAAIRARFGADLYGVLYYGSCRRSTAPDGLLDFYVVIDGTTTLNRLEAWLLWLLPPNVYYVEVPFGAARVRSKYTVVRLDSFLRGTSGRWFHSYLWGRFSQPTSIVWARDAAAHAELVQSLYRASIVFLRRVLPLVGDRFSAADLWLAGLTASYRTELRSERPEKLQRLYGDEAGYLDAVTAAGAPLCGYADPDAAASGYRNPLSATGRLPGRAAWRIRRVTGTLLSFLRILKSAYTFEGGLDYAVWKLERQSGRRIVIPPYVRARPWRHAPGFFWRLYREGVFR
jgi:hypothetical protein